MRLMSFCRKPTVPAKKGRGGADHGDHIHGHRGVVDQGRHTHDHEHARRDHGGGMDEREIGVGPSIASAARCAGKTAPDLPMAPMNSRIEMTSRAATGWPKAREQRLPSCAATALKMPSKEMVLKMR